MSFQLQYLFIRKSDQRLKKEIAFLLLLMCLALTKWKKALQSLFDTVWKEAKEKNTGFKKHWEMRKRNIRFLVTRNVLSTSLEYSFNTKILLKTKTRKLLFSFSACASLSLNRKRLGITVRSSVERGKKRKKKPTGFKK